MRAFARSRVSSLRACVRSCVRLTLFALAGPAAAGERLAAAAAVGVVPLLTGLFLLAEAAVGEGRLAEPASPLAVESVDGRDLAAFGLADPASGW